jgi:hypothetical protein
MQLTQTHANIGYHTANIVTLNGNHSLLVWGGLHHRGPTTKLEVFDLETNVWRAGKTR